MGRKRVKGKRWGSRIIDIDILLFDNQTVNKRKLKIPHPEMHKRRFVLLPLAELGAARHAPAPRRIDVRAPRRGQGRQEGLAHADPWLSCPRS